MYAHTRTKNIILFAQTQARCIISKEVTQGIELSITIVWQPSAASQELGSPGQIIVYLFLYHNKNFYISIYCAMDYPSRILAAKVLIYREINKRFSKDYWKYVKSFVVIDLNQPKSNIVNTDLQYKYMVYGYCFNTLAILKC